MGASQVHCRKELPCPAINQLKLRTQTNHITTDPQIGAITLRDRRVGFSDKGERRNAGTKCSGPKV